MTPKEGPGYAKGMRKSRLCPEIRGSVWMENAGIRGIRDINDPENKQG